MSQCVSLSFFRYSGLGARVWAFAQMGLARAPLADMPGVEFWKLCGSGSGEGFTPVPNTAVYALLATWRDRDCAEAGLNSSVVKRFEARSQEQWTVFLQPVSSWGKWSGQTPFAPVPKTHPAADQGPLAALTRATIRPGILLKFWGRVPAISRMIGLDENVAFKIGIGELPWLHQITFSIWPNAEAMAAFARKDGPHARAIHAVRRDNWFKEELYARFAIDGARGSWHGANPLAKLQQTGDTP